MARDEIEFDTPDIHDLLVIIFHDNLLCFCLFPVDLMLDFSIIGLKMVVPWSLPEDLLEDDSEPRAEMGNIFKDKVGG